MTIKEVKAELKVSRKRTGLTNEDLATLLNIDPARVSRLERERREPTVREMISLCLIYDKDIARLYPRTTAEVWEKLSHRIGNIDATAKGPQTRYGERSQHLGKLYERLTGGVPHGTMRNFVRWRIF